MLHVVLTIRLPQDTIQLRCTPLEGGDSRKEFTMNKLHAKTRTLTGLALLTAIVVVLQFLGAFIRFGPFSISLVLVPIVVGAALYGPWAGAWLGLVFGAVVLLSGDAGAFLSINPLGTVLTVLLKGALAGLVSGFVYTALAKRARAADDAPEKGGRATLSVVAAAIACPVVNTGVFLLGCLCFFAPTLTEWGASMGFASLGSYLIFGMVGANFLFELLVNILLSPVIVRLIHLGAKGGK